MSVRIGAVSYLNTKPLIYSLEKQLSDGELCLDLPSRLEDQLIGGRLDIALIPSIEYLRNHSELAVVSDACIACRGAVRSVQLLFRKPPHQVKTLALDEGSRTSAVLAQVLLREHYNIRPHCQLLPIASEFRNCSADAVMVIGDRAMKINQQEYMECWDLGEHWNRWASLPFVFAMWVARQSDLQRPEITRAVESLEQSRDAGVQHLSVIAKQQAPRYGLSEVDCLIYLRDQLHFFMGDQERLGLDLFRQHASRMDLVPTAAMVDC